MQEPARKGIVALLYKGTRYAKAISEDYRARTTNRSKFQRFRSLDIQPPCLRTRAFSFNMGERVTYFGNFLFIYPLKIASLRFLSLHTRRRRLSETGYHVCFFVKYIPYISIHSILKPPPRIENENSIGFCFTVGFDTCNYSGITNNNLL